MLTVFDTGFMPITTQFIILSDLHLAAGYSPQTDTYERTESFFHDAAFAHFLQSIIAQAAQEDALVHLLLLGDLFDFLRVAPIPGGKIYPPDTSEVATLQKLERIAAGHPVFFQTLGAFVAAGGRLDILPGNHDIELIRPSAQTRLIELIAGSSNLSSMSQQVTFFPWIYYVPGVFYAEHGQQQHELNAFKTLLTPYRRHHPEQIELPLGSYLDQYLFKPSRPKNLPPVPAPSFTRRLQAVGVALRHFSRLFSAPQAVRAAYHEQVLKPYAAEIGLNAPLLVALDDLSQGSPLSLARRIIRQQIVKRSQPSGDYLFEAARPIYALLRANHLAVPYLVFGHTHRAAYLPLLADSPAPLYLNAGSPAGSLASGGRLPEGHLPFISIRHNADKSTIQASLLSWNEPLRQIDRL